MRRKVWFHHILNFLKEHPLHIGVLRSEQMQCVDCILQGGKHRGTVFREDRTSLIQLETVAELFAEVIQDDVLQGAFSTRTPAGDSMRC